MLETAVGDGTEKFWLQQKIPEASRMNADIAALFVGVASGDCQVAFLRCGSIGGCWRGDCCIIGLEFLIRVVNEIFFVRHAVR